MKDQSIRKRRKSTFIEPMSPSRSRHCQRAGVDFEIKFGGYRCVAVKRARKVTLFSRHQKSWSRSIRLECHYSR